MQSKLSCLVRKNVPWEGRIYRGALICGCYPPHQPLGGSGEEKKATVRCWLSALLADARWGQTSYICAKKPFLGSKSWELLGRNGQKECRGQGGRGWLQVIDNTWPLIQRRRKIHGSGCRWGPHCSSAVIRDYFASIWKAWVEEDLNKRGKSLTVWSVAVWDKEQMRWLHHRAENLSVVVNVIVNLTSRITWKGVPVRTCLHETRLWASLWAIFFYVKWDGETHLPWLEGWLSS